MKINEDFRDDDFDYYEPEYDEPNPEETNLRDCQDKAYEYAKEVCDDVIKSQKNFLDENNLEIIDTDIEWDFSEYSIPREFTLLFYVARKDEYDDRVEDITCELELSGEFIGREWQKYYKATYEEPEEGGYFDYVEYDEDPSDLQDVITDFVNQVNKKFNSVDECFESLEEGEDTNKYEEIAKKMFSFYKDYDPYGYADAFGGLTGVNENDAINDTITSLVYDPQNILDELEEIKKDLEISLEDGENDTDRNYLRTVNDLIDTINALPNLNEAMFGPYKYRYEVHYVGDRDYLLGGSRDIDRAIDIACNQLENVASNPWENSNKKRKLINSLYILDTEQNEKVDSDDLTAYKKEVLNVLGESLEEPVIRPGIDLDDYNLDENDPDFWSKADLAGIVDYEDDEDLDESVNESAETTKLYKAISDTADAIDDLTVDDLESAIKNLDSADDKISDVKDNLEDDPEEGWH